MHVDHILADTILKRKRGWELLIEVSRLPTCKISQHVIAMEVFLSQIPWKWLLKHRSNLYLESPSDTVVENETQSDSCRETIVMKPNRPFVRCWYMLVFLSLSRCHHMCSSSLVIENVRMVCNCWYIWCVCCVCE